MIGSSVLEPFIFAAAAFAFLDILTSFFSYRVVARTRDIAWRDRSRWQVVAQALVLWIKRRRAWRSLPGHEDYRKKYPQEPSSLEYNMKESLIHNVVTVVILCFLGWVFFAAYVALESAALRNSLPKFGLDEVIVLAALSSLLGVTFLMVLKSERDREKYIKQERQVCAPTNDTMTAGRSKARIHSGSTQVLLDRGASDRASPDEGDTMKNRRVRTAGVELHSQPTDPLSLSARSEFDAAGGLKNAKAFLDKIEGQREPVFSSEAFTRVEQIARDKKKAIALLKEAGFLDENGKLSARYHL
jgi:hypothetical protein